MTTLVLLAHAVPSVRPLYEAALAPLGGSFVVRPFVSTYPGLSSAYERLADELQHGGRILPALLAKYAPGVAFDRVVLAWWSGGYALARRVLSIEIDAEALDGCVALDGMHTGLTAGSPPRAARPGLEAFARFAGWAKAGRKVFHVAHTDVPTPQTGASAYASTTQSAEELLAMVGGAGGSFRVDAFNLEPASRAAAEHVHALRTWGPEYVAGAVAPWVSRVDASAPTDPPPPVVEVESLASRALTAAIGSLAVREATGRNDGQQIGAFFAGATRRGTDGQERLTGWTPGWEWCAAFASWCCHTQLRSGETAPHGWRIAVHELVADARARGTWRDLGYDPRPGDLVVLARGGGDPRKGGLGHVGRVELVDGGEIQCIDGNSANKGVARVRRHLDDPTIVGWVAYSTAWRPAAIDLVLSALGRFGGDARELAAKILAEGEP